MAVEGLPTELVVQTRHEYRRWGPQKQMATGLIGSRRRGSGVGASG